MPTNKYHAHIHADVATLNHAVAQYWVDRAAHAIAARGEFHVALSGGTTPRALYECLASVEFVTRIAWQHVHIWFGDERTVPPQHPDSNYCMAYNALLQHVPVLPAHIHRIEGEQDDVHEAARVYQAQLMAHLPSAGPGNFPVFDLILLGLGPDGHVASLFPDTPILTEREQWVAAVFVEKFNTWRISLTLPVIDNARHIMVLVAGTGKAEIVGEILGGSCEPPRSPRPDIADLSTAQPATRAHYPVEMIHAGITIDWYLDVAAASHIAEEHAS